MITRPIPPAASGGTYIPPEDTFEVHTAIPAVRFVTQAAQPPSDVYVSTGEALTLSAASSQPGEAVTVNYRLLLAGGGIHTGQFTMQVSSNRAVNVHAEALAEGYLLSASCSAAVATTRGQTFARLFISKTALGVGQPSYMLMADYVTTEMAPGHPNGRVLAPSEGPGWSHVVFPTNPPAGADWQANVPQNAVWAVRSLSAKLTTSVAVANRSVHVQMFDNIQNIFTSANFGATQAASLTLTYSASQGVPLSAGGATFNDMPLPSFALLHGTPGATVPSLTESIQVADQWNQVNVEVEEWLDNV